MLWRCVHKIGRKIKQSKIRLIDKQNELNPYYTLPVTVIICRVFGATVHIFIQGYNDNNSQINGSKYICDTYEMNVIYSIGTLRV